MDAVSANDVQAGGCVEEFNPRQPAVSKARRIEANMAFGVEFDLSMIFTSVLERLHCIKLLHMGTGLVS